jgi:hypothetical protein
LYYIGRRLLTQEDYIAFLNKASNLSSRFNSIESWQPNIQQNQVGSEFFGFPNRFYSVCDLSDDMQFRSFRQHRADKSPKRFEVIGNKHSDW